MATKRTGTQITADAARELKWAAETCDATEYRPRLKALAEELDTVAGHHYLKTRRGSKEAARLADELATLRSSLAACQEDDPAQSYCEGFFSRLEWVTEHVKTIEMK
jgi:hypothetical protein